MKPAISPTLIDQVTHSCIDFIERNKLADKAPDNIANAIYLVRNAVVHRQIQVLSETYPCFRDLNVLFFQLCVEIIEKFDLETGERNLLASIAQSEAASQGA